MNFQKTGPSHTFSGKHEIRERHEAPGPGNYDPKNVLHEINRKSSFGVKIPKTAEKVDMGPGKYSPDTKKVGRKYSFGRGNRSVSEKRNLTPGPGNYDTRGNINTTQRSGYSFGSSARTIG